jgi:polar amino acid transport system substrate-binding protein
MEKAVSFTVKQSIIPRTGILAGVSTGKYDAAVTAILFTAERMKVLDFTTPVAQSVDDDLKPKNDRSIIWAKDFSASRLASRRAAPSS